MQNEYSLLFRTEAEETRDTTRALGIARARQENREDFTKRAEERARAAMQREAEESR